MSIGAARGSSDDGSSSVVWIAGERRLPQAAWMSFQSPLWRMSVLGRSVKKMLVDHPGGRYLSCKRNIAAESHGGGDGRDMRWIHQPLVAIHCDGGWIRPRPPLFLGVKRVARAIWGCRESQRNVAMVLSRSAKKEGGKVTKYARYHSLERSRELSIRIFPLSERRLGCQDVMVALSLSRRLE